jgi:hypothetical protein
MTSFAPNDIDGQAAKAYRAALEKSYAATKTLGLTELWSDDGSTVATVLAWDPKTATGVQDDLENDEVDKIDFESMMPQANIDELDGLEANTGFDVGSLSSPSPGVFVVTIAIDESSMITTYTIDDQGRIASAVATIDNEPAGSATFVYSVTAEGMAALAKLS